MHLLGKSELAITRAQSGRTERQQFPMVAACVGLVFALCGCGTTYHFDVTTMAAAQPPEGKETYHLLDITEGTYANLVSFERLAAALGIVLSGHGHAPAPTLVDADYIVYVDYGFETPRRFTTHVEARQTQIYASSDYPAADFRGSTEIGEYGAPSVEAEATPLHFIKTVYPKFLRLKAVEDSDGGRHLWYIEICRECDSVDLEGFLPIMVAALADHIGTQSTNTIRVSMNSQDQRVQLLRSATPVPRTTPHLAYDLTR